MFATVLPLRAILFQILFLTIAIALESFVFQKRLYLSWRTSIEYGVSLNLFSTVFGWTIFFLVHPLLPVGFQEEIVNFILFGKFANHFKWLYFDLAAFILLAFLLIFFTELLGLDFLINFTRVQSEPDLSIKIFPRRDRETKPKRQTEILHYARQRGKSQALLIANSASQSLILLIAFILVKF